MKVVKLSPDDPDIFLTEPTAGRCSFLENHLESFMQMYKAQGSTFWLRFLVSYKFHIEEKFCGKTCITLHQSFQFIKVLNFFYISIHKRFIEGSNTSVKKLIHNLLNLTMNYPHYLNYNFEQWLKFLRTTEHLNTTFQNLFEMPEASAFTNFICSVHIDFFCALCAVFQEWCGANVLTEEEVNKIDSKIIYWLPPYDTRDKIKPLCFERYISDYWKEDLQRMLMIDNVHNLFSMHKTEECCGKFDEENDMFQLTDVSLKDLMKALNKGAKEQNMQTVTEICVKDICVLKPQVVVCSVHEACFVRIRHSEKCCEPFLCKGDPPCILTCETKIKNMKSKQTKNSKFWKTVSVETFPVNEKKCDASTVAESYDRDIQTFLHLRKTADFDLSLTMMRNGYQCVAELHNFDFNPRRTECLNRLRKKLSQKNPLITPRFNPSSLRQPFYREHLLESATMKVLKLQQQYCSLRNHSGCNGKCFDRDANSVAVSSSNAFGRVIFLSKISISVPSELTAECCCSKADAPNDSKKSQKKSNGKKGNKVNKGTNTSDKFDENTMSSNCSVQTVNPDEIDISDILSSEENITPSVEEDEYSAANIDDDIDEICKLLGIGESDGTVENHDSTRKTSLSDDKIVDDFLKLIGVQDESDKNSVIPSDSKSEPLNEVNLRVCAYCDKKETRRRMFKKCSKCKEDNFPVHHYYCSQECLAEDWAESHEDEHLKFSKQLS